MDFKRIDQVVLFGAVVGLVLTCLVAIGGCLPGEFETTRIVDPQGRPVYDPGGTPPFVRTLPTTGRPAIDWAVGGVAAAVYGALAYYVRRVKVNGGQQVNELAGRVKDLEMKPPAYPVANSSGMGKDELRRIVDFLAFEETQRNGRPPGDGAAQ